MSANNNDENMWRRRGGGEGEERGGGGGNVRNIKGRWVRVGTEEGEREVRKVCKKREQEIKK